jgi:hypothetical protein
VQAEQRQDRHDHHDQADQIDDAIHKDFLTLIEMRAPAVKIRCRVTSRPEA